MLLTFSTVLTLARIALIPWIVVTLAAGAWLRALLLFGIAVLTDIFDGYFARLWKQETALGACLDPLADKLLMVACYATLVMYPVPELPIPTWFLAVVAIKEAILLLGALYFGLLRHTVQIKPSLWGKLAMVAQSGLVGWLIVCFMFGWEPLKTFHIFLGIAAVLVVVSLAHYALGVFSAIYRKK